MIMSAVGARACRFEAIRAIALQKNHHAFVRLVRDTDGVGVN